MTKDEVLNQLQALGSAKLREQSAKRGVTGAQFGVKMVICGCWPRKSKQTTPWH